jgi:two-component system chemotaxis sensor kinase CheA
MHGGVAGEGLLDEVLALISALRNAVTDLSEARPDPAVRNAVLPASEALHDCLSRAQLEPLLPCGAALVRLTKIWDAQGASLDGLLAAVGIVEQSLDGLASGMSPDGLRGLYDGLRRVLPPPWQAHLDSDEATFDAQLRAGPHAETPTEAISEAPESPEQALQRELRATFLAEADEGFSVCEELLVQMEQRPDDREVLEALLRKFHTLKGGAAAVDLSEAAAQLHNGESLLQAARDATAVVDAVVLVDFLLRLVDSVRGLIDRSCGRARSPYVVMTDVEREIAALSSPPPAEPPPGGSAEPQPGEGKAGATDVMPGHLSHPDPVVLGSQLHALTELRNRLGRGEGAGDIRQFIEALDQQARQFWDLATELKEQVSSLVVVPLEQVFRRLQRPARDAARQEGKLVALELAGGETRVDHAIAERVYAPLLHVVRNAVSHGIERPPAREAAGKHRTGMVRVRAELCDRTLVLTVEDDGRGLDLAAIRAKAASLGWINPQQPPARAELVRLILRSGFSTRDDVTDLAGRGVGMDVVARDVEALGGVIDIESSDGKGTRIVLSIPLDHGDAAAVRRGLRQAVSEGVASGSSGSGSGG